MSEIVRNGIRMTRLPYKLTEIGYLSFEMEGNFDKEIYDGGKAREKFQLLYMSVYF